MSLNPLKYPLITRSIRVHFESFNSLQRRTGTHRSRPTFQGFFCVPLNKMSTSINPLCHTSNCQSMHFSLFTMMQSQVYFKHPTDRRSWDVVKLGQFSRISKNLLSHSFDPLWRANRRPSTTPSIIIDGASCPQSATNSIGSPLAYF